MSPKNSSIVWTPFTLGEGVGIYLNRTFADRCRKFEHPDTRLLLDGVWRLAGNKKEQMPSNFLDFESGILPKGIYANLGGLWLTLEQWEGKPDEALIYHAHNANSLRAQWWIIQAFEAWAVAAHILLPEE